MEYFFQKAIEKTSYLHELPFGEYEQCEFRNIDFSKFNFNQFKFIDCVFIDCDLSMASLAETVINKVSFQACKMRGLHWEQVNKFTFGITCSDCNFAHSSFFKVKLVKTNFKNCFFEECDFSETDMSNSQFENCDFRGANFEGCNMTKTNFRSSINFSINPITNKVKGAQFDLATVAGLLDIFQVKLS